MPFNGWPITVDVMFDCEYDNVPPLKVRGTKRFESLHITSARCQEFDGGGPALRRTLIFNCTAYRTISATPAAWRKSLRGRLLGKLAAKGQRKAAHARCPPCAGRRSTRGRSKSSTTSGGLFRAGRAAVTPMPCALRRFEGFSPTPEFPEIAEAQALLAAL